MKKMRVVLVTDNYDRKMGYLQNNLPMSMGELGIDMHVITLDLPPYYMFPDVRKAYDEFSSEKLVPGTTEQMDGFQLHIVGHRKQLGYVRGVGLKEKIAELKPDIVQTMAAISWIPVDCAVLKRKLGFKLFTASHYTASVFPLATAGLPKYHPQMIKAFLTRFLHGRWVSWHTERFYGATSDCTDVAVRFFGVEPKKTAQSELGVNTSVFYPATTEEDREASKQIRERFNISDDEIFVLYTGRFFPEKQPIVLAHAIAKLQAMGEPYRAVFMGSGEQKDGIEACDGCTVSPFVPFVELGSYFRAADIGCWPAAESMSMIDAAACGIPIVINHTVKATERVEGNGLMYQLMDVDDLVRVLLELKDPAVRKKLGDFGAEKIRENFSWKSLAKQRIADYEAALNGTLK
jgi:glycosyltransferase involved in cell wall biosynthesis